MTAEVAYVFIDANTALHYKRPDQIDWRSLTGSCAVVLVAAPILHRELEYQKVHNPSRKLRDRAGAYIKWLVQFVRDSTLSVRENTTWHFVPTEPNIDCVSNGLSPTIADDQLIASVIAYGSSTTGSVYVATADIGLEVKLRHRHLTPLILSNADKLPDEPDAQEKELQNLRRQIAQQRSPQLSLVTGLDGNRHLMKIQPQIIVPSAPPMAQILRDNPELSTDQAPSSSKDRSPGGLYELYGSSVRSTFLTPERISRYNAERARFLADYEAFLEKLLAWEEQEALTVELQLSISNDGTAPANNVDVILHLPDDLVLMAKDDLPDRPKRPTPPSRPTAFSELSAFGARDFNADFLRGTNSNFAVPDINDSVSVESARHQIGYWTRSLKHGFQQQFDPVYFCFPNRDSVRQFAARYRISADELPQIAEGELNFVTLLSSP